MLPPPVQHKTPDGLRFDFKTDETQELPSTRTFGVDENALSARSDREY